MSKGLSASTIKSWFQYRCERKVKYELSSDEELAAVPIIKDVREPRWAILGVDFERRVVSRLNREQGVLQPDPGEDWLSERLGAAFLKGQVTEPYAAQINLRTKRTPAFLGASGLKLARTFPDLVRRSVEDGQCTFTVIDVKATRRATAFHKTQVAFYVRVLEELLREMGVVAQINAMGEVWRIPEDGTAEGDSASPEIFSLKPYLRLVDEFCADVLPGIAGKHLDRTRDDTFFHLYFKCEQCSFFDHCIRSVDADRPAERRDVSAVPGITHEAKRSLQRLGIRSVASLSKATGLAQAPGIGWSLSRRANTLVGRAEALTSQTISRSHEKHTFLMPPRVDAILLLSVDHDPIDDRIATIAYRLVKNGVITNEAIAVPASGSLQDEAEAIVAVMAPMILDLQTIDEGNSAGGNEYAHIFLYEPAEGVNLQKAVGRHLDDDRIRGGLLHLVRLFPPEEVIPEPEFRGMHHLPATAVRSVVEQLYNLPVVVSYDLRQVSGAIATGGSGGPAYSPKKDFIRPFSSLLSIDVIRQFREGGGGAPTREQIIDDVRARLDTLGGIVSWLFQENERSTTAGAPLLRLRKKPFRFQASFDPLNVVDLEVLQACELLDSRAGLLDTLIKLAQPSEQRRDLGRCLANLTLLRHWSKGPWELLRFSVPSESQQAELGPSDFNLIVTDGSADLLLDPSNWAALRCRLLPPNEGYETRHDTLLVSMDLRDFRAAPMQDLLRTTPAGEWHIDASFQDINSSKAVRFLAGLADVT